ncbi:MAG TPA: hypothetical protein VGQ83_37855 [Polyangia bacterium]|jgi:hypothetical protein
MRYASLPVLALAAVTLASCADYFDGTNLYFNFSKLQPLITLAPTDKDCAKITDQATCEKPGAPPLGHAGCGWGLDPKAGTCDGDPTTCAGFKDQSTCEKPENNGACTWQQDPTKFICTGNQLNGVCADEAYIAANPGQATDSEYRAWATINGGPVLLARFTVRECTFASGDKDLKNAITSIKYRRNAQTGYPAKATATEPASGLYGAVDTSLNAFLVGMGYMTTEVRLGGATEIFITKEPLGAPETASPSAIVIMSGPLHQEGDVYNARLDKVSTSLAASGNVTAIVINRSSAW